MKYIDLLKIASFSPKYIKSPDSWVGHLPFAAWIIQQVAPNIFVELGTHSGNSYFAFCQAVAEKGLSVKCYAVDTWQGDEHAGKYSDEIFDEVDAYNQTNFSGFSRLLRMTFDDAAPGFDDASIGLLHIDGLHTYEAVRHDFETWLPKLAPGAVVLFHDTNVRERGFGVWKFWRELQSVYPCNLEFIHSHGLGVLQLSTDLASASNFGWLGPDAAERKEVIDFFAAQGSRHLEHFKYLQAKKHISFLNNEAEERNGEIARLNNEIAERDGQLALLRRSLAERDGKIEIFQHLQNEQERKINTLHTLVSKNLLIKVGCKLERVSYKKLWEYNKLKKEIQTQPLLDEQWYRRQYPDVGREGISPLRHYYFFGADEGKNPHPFFNTRWYLEEYPDVAEQTLNPLLHYLKFGTIERRNPNPYFNTGWYLDAYPEVAEGGMNPLLHYLAHGVGEGKDPNPYFDTRWYLETYPEVAESGMNPLLHFMTRGIIEGKNPSPYFDTQWYADTYPQVIRKGMDPLAYYMKYGITERTSPNPFFDTQWYASEYPGVAGSGMDLMLHYIRYGADEGKNPNPYFDTRWYRDAYPEVAESGVNPLRHFLLAGAGEGKNPSPYFDSRWYRDEYPEVAKSGMHPLQHYLTRGIAEGKNPNPYFHAGWYAATYPEVGKKGMNPLLHYLKHGVAEGTNPCPYFDTLWYLKAYPDIQHHGFHPLAHYLWRGRDEQRNPGPHFDVRWYLSQYPDVFRSGEDPVLQYIKHGAEEGKNPNPYFDTDWYLETYPDVAHNGMNPLAHFIQYGIAEGRTPNPHFGAACYLDEYCRWVWTFDTLNDDDRKAIRQHIGEFANTPLFSILLPVYDPPPRFLDEAIQSVRNQLYPFWELCIADDASRNPEIRSVIERHAAEEQRIKVVYRTENGHISRASNSALALASGEFIALLDHDDILAEHALFWVAEAMQRQPEAGLLYSDEDKLDPEGNRKDPYFKCDWNPYLFLGHNMICHLGVYRAEIVRKLGGFRVGYEGSQDYDLAARVVETLHPNQILHIPRVLYHWRVVSGSTAGGTQEKPYALIASEKVVAEHLERQGLRGTVTGIPTLGGMHRVVFERPENPPLVSLLIPTRNGEDLVRKCIESIIQKTLYPEYEIILIDNGSDSPRALGYFAELAKNPRIRVIKEAGPFNFSRLNNRGANEARGDILLLLNNDTEVIVPDWLDEIVALAVQPKIGAVGARLWYPDGTLQHGGVILGLGGCAAHEHSLFPRESPGYFGRAQLLHSVSAVTGACLAVKKAVFEEVGGFDEKGLKVGYNDIDFCLKLREKGYWNVWTPRAELTHYESVSRGYEVTPEKITRFLNEISLIKKRWPNSFFHDPAYNPNLTLDSADFALSGRPRIAMGSALQPEIFEKRFIPAPVKKPRLLIVTGDRNKIPPPRVQHIAESLLRQGMIAAYTIADRFGPAFTTSPLHGWFDVLCLHGNAADIRWFHRSVLGCLPYLVDWDDAACREVCRHGKQENVLAEIRHTLVHSAAVSVPNQRALRYLENKTGLDLEYCTSVIDNGLAFVPKQASSEKIGGLLWRADDAAAVTHSREGVLQAINEFSLKYQLPVYCLGKFPTEILDRLAQPLPVDIAQPFDYLNFLDSHRNGIGIASAEINAGGEDIAPPCVSDIRMVEYGGFGIPGIYSAVPAYLETDLHTGRIVRNSYEEWMAALENTHADISGMEEKNMTHIQELRSVDRLAREQWWPVLERVMLASPLPSSVLRQSEGGNQS